MVTLYDLETRVRIRQANLRREAAHEALLRLASMANPARAHRNWFEPVSGLLSVVQQILVAPPGFGAPAPVACATCP